MKKIIVTFCLVLTGLASFSQAMKENGTIYINHPYIDIVNNSTKSYLMKDNAALTKIYADTAKFWVSGMDKPMPIAAAITMWNGDFDYYDSVQVKTVGYPDYLHYIDQDGKVVQSWWQWMGKSKKTGHWLKVDFVQFDSFNKDGKIDFEGNYGDWSKFKTD